MVCVYIDEFTPCLKDTQTGDILETEVIRISRKSFLSKFNKKNGWYVNWAGLVSQNEIYALVLKGTVDIQGLIALTPNKDFQSVYISWMVSAPQNNKQIVEVPKYTGVGGHLFAIAIDRSLKYGFGGMVTGFAANENLLAHYCKVFHADPIRMLHPYQFIIDEGHAQEIKEMYEYEWSGDEL